MKKLGVGAIGVGGICVDHHLPHWQSHPHTELKIVCDLHSARARSVASNFQVANWCDGWKDLIARDDVDIVDIATPNHFHAPIAIAALEAGKHVFCEKPMATNGPDARRMLDASRATDKRLMINHHFRFARTTQDLLREAKRGILGSPYFAQCRWNRRRRVPVAPTFIRKELAGAGPMLDIGVHVVDLALMFMGFPKALRATGSVGRHLAHRTDLGGDWGAWDHHEYDVEDFAVGSVQFEGGASLFVETSWLGFHDVDEEWSVKILGTQAGLYWPKGLIVTERDKTPIDIQLQAKDADHRPPYRESIHRFVDSIIYNTPTPIPPEESLQVVEIMDAIYRSSVENREVTIATSA